MKSPKREMQQLLDYLRYKVLRRIKKRRKRLQESAQKQAERWFQHKIRRPQYADGKDNGEESEFGNGSPLLTDFNTYRYDLSYSKFNPADAIAYVDWWYKNRNKQIQNNLSESGLSGNQANKQHKNMFNTWWTLRGFGVPKNVKKTTPDIYFLDSFQPGSPSRISFNQDDITNVGGFFAPNWQIGTKLNLVNINTPIMPFLVHEATHSQDPQILTRIIPKHLKLRKGVSPNDYLDNPDEINSRLMELRYINNLDPNKKYTIDDIRKMGTDYKLPNGQVKSTDILNRYDDSTLLWLINELAYNENNLDLLYANRGKDSGIHINPKNRGKFNATKKRTGKTTALLAHSKNPLTRKRAIFALNAKKWKH